MATRNPVNSPLEVGSLSYYLQGFGTIPGGDRRIPSINSIDPILEVRILAPPRIWRSLTSVLVFHPDRKKILRGKNGGVSCDRFFAPENSRMFP